MERPNLLIVFPDQMRGSAMGFLGEEPVVTPYLDEFAHQGLILKDAVSNCPLCSPCRAMLMTGKYPHANKVISNCYSRTAPYGVELKETDRCWSDVLRDRGYSLGYIGKWHLDAPQEPYVDCANNRGETAWNEWCPPRRRHGFDFWYSYGAYDCHTRPMCWRNDAKRDDFHFVDQWGPEHEADVAIKYLSNEGGTHRNPRKPFGLVVSMNPPHMPYDLVPERYVEQYEGLTVEELCTRPNIPREGTEWGDYYRANIRNYLAMITGVDHQFGRILKALDHLGLADDTIVVFTSDHGNCLGIHDKISKSNYYEESVRVPFIIRWRGTIPHRLDDLLISVPDVYPTLMDLMGFGEDIPGDIEGISYAQSFRGNNGPRPQSQLCLGIPVDRPAFGWRAVRTNTHTLVVNRAPDRADEVVLHSNLEDPYQLQNVAGDNRELVRLLSKELNRWLQKTNDPWIRSQE